MTALLDPPSKPAINLTGGSPASARIDALVDAASFELTWPADASGVLAGVGRLAGRPVSVFATDPTVMGGALGAEGCERIARTIDAARKGSRPVVGIWHSGGARLQEGVASLHGMGQIFASTVAASGRVPQVSVVLGPAAGGAAYGPALTDLVVLGPAARVFVTGPDVVRSVTGEDVDAAQLGGPDPHGRRSGVAHVITDTDDEALAQAAAFVDLLDRPGTLSLSGVGPDHELAGLLPASTRRAYDVRPVLARLLDAGTLHEVHAGWAPNVVVALGRLAGRAVGVLANNPLRMGGCLDAIAAEKAARFVRLCDSFGLPIVVVVDVPGYLPGVGQEWEGVVRRGAKLLYAFAEARVPRVTLVTRKAYGGAYIAMNSRALGATAVYAWTDAEVAVMGASAAVGILHRKKLAAASDDDRPAMHAELAVEHERLSGGLGRAVDMDLIDGVVDPADSRRCLAAAIDAAPARRGRHGNIPL